MTTETRLETRPVNPNSPEQIEALAERTQTRMERRDAIEKALDKLDPINEAAARDIREALANGEMNRPTIQGRAEVIEMEE